VWRCVAIVHHLADILFDFARATLRREVEFNLVRIVTILNQFVEIRIVLDRRRRGVDHQPAPSGRSCARFAQAAVPPDGATRRPSRRAQVTNTLANQGGRHAFEGE
jgi:hypothetical protein